MTKSMKKFLGWIITIAILLIIVLCMGPFYIINEGEQVVVTRIGRIVDTHTDAGLHIKVPFIDKITTYPKRVLSLDGDPQPIHQGLSQLFSLRWTVSPNQKPMKCCYLLLRPTVL